MVRNPRLGLPISDMDITSAPVSSTHLAAMASGSAPAASAQSNSGGYRDMT